MQQIVDLQKAPNFQALHVALVNVTTDQLPALTNAAREWSVTTPLVSDTDRKVSQSYGVLQWAMPSGEPGHTFVLVGQDGRVKWIRDYGAPQNGGLMYVPVNDLSQEITQRLNAR
jgi:peroxiredoxin